MPRRGGECPVASQERRTENFSEGDVGGVIGREVTAQFPDTLEERPMGVAFERHLSKGYERLTGALWRHLAGCLIAPQNLRNFQVDQVRSVEFFVRVEQARRKPCNG